MFNYAVVSSRLDVIKKGSCDMSITDFKEFESVIESYQSCIVLEPTGSYHINLPSFCVSNGIRIALINPILIKRFSQIISPNIKTGAVDAAVMAKMKDINRFVNRNKFTAYAGIDPSIKQSGTSLNMRGKISKKGSKYLRGVLYLTASDVMKFNDYFRAYYLKKKSEDMLHRKAMIALCNKLGITLFAMLTKIETFHLVSS